MNVETTETSQFAPAPDRTVLEIVTGRKMTGEIMNRRLAGHAYLPGGSEIYELKLMMFPRQTYFMRQNKGSLYRYTVFAKRVWENDESRLSNAVGFAELSSNCRNYIEIYFPLLGRLIFLDLIPKNY